MDGYKAIHLRLLARRIRSHSYKPLYIVPYNLSCVVPNVSEAFTIKNDCVFAMSRAFEAVWRDVRDVSNYFDIDYQTLSASISNLSMVLANNDMVGLSQCEKDWLRKRVDCRILDTWPLSESPRDVNPEWYKRLTMECEL